MIRDKSTHYYLPKKWAEYLVTQPETGMGYQIADIYLKGKMLKNVIVLGCLTFNYKNKKLDLNNIEKIVVKEKKFQTVSVKNTPIKEDKASYYLIEEYTEYDDRPGGSSWKAYEVQNFGTKDQLLGAILKGSKHGGKLIPAKGLELKLQLIEDNQEDLREALRQDMKRREEAYCKTRDIIDDFPGIT